MRRRLVYVVSRLLVLGIVLSVWRVAGTLGAADQRGLTLLVSPDAVPQHQSAVLVVHVLDSSGNPVSGATIALTGGSAASGSPLVTGSGALQLRVTPSGSAPIVVRASRSGYLGVAAQVEVVAPIFPATVSALRPSLNILASGVKVTRVARKGDPLQFLWHAHAGAKDRGSLTFADGSVLDLDNNTDVLIKSPTRLYLQTGQVYLQVVNGGQSHDIETGSAVAASLGTRYVVRVVKGNTTVVVVSGRVSVRNLRHGAAVSLAKNQESTVLAGAPPSPPRSVDPSAAITWTVGLPVAANAGSARNVYLLKNDGQSLATFSIDQQKILGVQPLPAPATDLSLDEDGQDLALATRFGLVDLCLCGGTAHTLTGRLHTGALAALPNHRVAVADPRSDTVAVYNTFFGRVLHTVPLGYTPTGIAASPDGSLAAVSGEGDVSLVSLSNGSVMTTRDLPGVVGRPAFSADGRLVFVGLPQTGQLVVLAVSAEGAVNTVNLRPAGSVAAAQTGGITASLSPDTGLIAVGDSNGRAYIADAAARMVDVVDPIGARVLARYPVPAVPVGMILAQEGKLVITTSSPPSVLEMDPADGFILNQIRVPGLSGSLIMPRPHVPGGSASIFGTQRFNAVVASSVPQTERIPLAPGSGGGSGFVSGTGTGSGGSSGSDTGTGSTEGTGSGVGSGTGGAGGGTGGGGGGTGGGGGGTGGGTGGNPTPTTQPLGSPTSTAVLPGDTATTTATATNIPLCQVALPSTITTSMELTASPCSTYTSTGTAISPRGSLTVDSGVMIRFSGSGLDVQGGLQVLGTAAAPVTFTSAAASPLPGDWGGITFESSATGSISNTTVAFAGNNGGARPAVDVAGGTPSFDHLTIDQAFGLGLRAQAASRPTVSNSTFTNNRGVAIELGDPGAFAGLSGNNSFSGNALDGAYLDGGDLAQNVAWSPAVDGRIELGGSVRVRAGSTLTIGAGATVLAASGTSLVVLGALNTSGTAAQRVTFSSAAIPPSPGDWDGLRFGTGATGNLAAATVSFAGNNGGNTFQYAAVSLVGSSPTFNDLTVDHSAGPGLGMSNDTNTGSASNPVIGNSHFSANGFQGIVATSGCAPTISGSTFSGNVGLAVELGDPDAIAGVSADNFTGNGLDGTFLDHGNVTRSVSWSTSNDGTVELGRQVTVNAGVTLSLAPGMTVAGAASGNGFLDVSGVLRAPGTAAAPIVFTSSNALPGRNVAPKAGDWFGVYFESGSSGALSFVTIAYAGYNFGASGPAMKLTASAPTLDHLTIDQSFGDGLQAVNGSVPPLDNSTFTRNGGAAINLDNPDTTAGMTHNIFQGNDLDGVLVNGTLSRTATWSPAADGTVKLSMNANLIVGSNTTLTVAPGTTVRGDFYSTIQVLGALMAPGTPAQPITLTGTLSNPWLALTFDAGSSGNLSYTTIAYAGNTFGNVPTYALLVRQSSPTFDHLTINHSLGGGMQTDPASVPHISNSTFTNNGGEPLDLGNVAATTFLTGSNTYSGNGGASPRNGIEIEASSLRQSTTWSPAADGVILLDGDAEVNTGATLTLAADTKVLGIVGAGEIVVDAGGTLNSAGTSGHLVVLDSASGAAARWHLPLIFSAGANGNLAGTKILDVDTALSVQTNNVIHVHGSSMDLSDGYSITNGGGAIVDATGNWWGNPTGPTNSTTNPRGRGVGVDTNVDISGFLTSPPS